jgi:hypothetical protein
MWLQPWFFSMRLEHFGHFFVFTMIQLADSLELWHFSLHCVSCWQLVGSCISSPHLKQKLLPQVHVTLLTPWPITIFSQPGAGQKRCDLD